MEEIQPLTHLAGLSIMTSLIRWRCDLLNDDELKKSISEVTNYFEILPSFLRETVLQILLLHDDGDDNIVHDVRHIAIFVPEDIKELEFYVQCGKHFDFLYLLDTCRLKLQNLEDLRLPDSFNLDLITCEKMCQYMPNLKTLDISKCLAENNALQCIAKLPLEEFYPPSSISENVIKYFCQEDSKVRQTLRVFYVGSFTSIENCWLILKSMPLIEDVYLPNSRWLYILPHEMKQQKFNLKNLTFDSLDMHIEDELEIAVSTCPKVTTIIVETTKFTTRLIGLLTKFKNLIDLDLNVALQSELEHTLDDYTFNLISLNNLCFSCLRNLSLTDQGDCWVSSGCLLTILGMCPNLDHLHLMRCDGFSNRTAAGLTQLMLNRSLRYLSIIYCNLLGPSGVKDVLRIPSLTQLRVVLKSSDVMKQHFLSNFNDLTSDAVKYKVNMEICILDTDEH